MFTHVYSFPDHIDFFTISFRIWMVNHAMHSMAEVDLAGSERLAKSGVSGDRQKEAPLSRCDSIRQAGRPGGSQLQILNCTSICTNMAQIICDVASYEGKNFLLKHGKPSWCHWVSVFFAFAGDQDQSILERTRRCHCCKGSGTKHRNRCRVGLPFNWSALDHPGSQGF